MNTEQFDTFVNHESTVRSYCRTYPTKFSTAKGSFLYDFKGNEYIDFLSGAGALNYGHNNPFVKQAMLDYISNDGILMSLDLHSQMKEEFIESFHQTILLPRGLNYKLQFTSPAGTCAVESAIKLARKWANRQNIVSFTNAFHGMTGNALSVTGNRYHRQSVSFGDVFRMPYDGYLGDNINTIVYFRRLLEDSSSGLDLPAAVILETIQGEGGLNVASIKWLQQLRALTEEYGILLIVDDIQSGCGRTGNFFSFERANIKPDIVCLSKSIGGNGLPFAVLLFSPVLDVWSQGEDNGTFRGNNLAFLSARIIIDKYWRDSDFESKIMERAAVVTKAIHSIVGRYPVELVGLKGLGMMQGIEFVCEHDCTEVIKNCFENYLIIESCGDGKILKLMSPLTIELKTLQHGLSIIEKAIEKQFASKTTHSKVVSDTHSAY